MKNTVLASYLYMNNQWNMYISFIKTDLDVISNCTGPVSVDTRSHQLQFES